MLHRNIPDLARQLDLVPHPEGGWYRETYRPQATVPVPWTDSLRPAATGILFLLEAGNFSAFHRIRSDEMWHLYHASPDTVLHVHQILPDGSTARLVLGNRPDLGESFQGVVPAGAWFAAEPASRPHGRHTPPLNPDAAILVGCTVAPGFDFADFELARAADLAALHPSHADLIRRLCRE